MGQDSNVKQTPQSLQSNRVNDNISVLIWKKLILTLNVSKRSLSQKAPHSFESKFILYKAKQVDPKWFKWKVLKGFIIVQTVHVQHNKKILFKISNFFFTADLYRQITPLRSGSFAWYTYIIVYVVDKTLWEWSVSLWVDIR